MNACRPPTILAIETSGRAGTIALRIDGRAVGERSLAQTGRRHAQTLVAQIDTLVRDAGLRLDELSGAAVSIGPGSFTGLRVGVMCAKTLTWATGCRLAAVDTLRAIAENSPADVEEVHAVSDAQRGGLFHGFYRRDGEAPFRRVGEVEIVDAAGWCSARGRGDVVTGPGLDRYGGGMADTVRVLEAALWNPTASVVARLGEEQITAGQTADLWTLEPFYLRQSAAEEKAADRSG